MTSDTTRPAGCYPPAGLYEKYRVERNDPTGKHADCRYFVLDPQHDPVAREALILYAARTRNRALRRDIYEWLDGIERGENDE